MEKLNEFSLSLEFLLISVVQGVALAALATAASDPVASLRFEYYPYIICSFIIILSFWAVAIIHAISFIDWPIDLAHSFLYFLASFIEVMAFSHLTNPLIWFGLVTVFFMVVVVSYYVDYKMILVRKDRFKTPEKRKLFNHILGRQIFEMKFLMPAAAFISFIFFCLILINPNLFIKNHSHIYLIGIQAVLFVLVLFESVRNFKTRARLVTESAN